MTWRKSGLMVVFLLAASLLPLIAGVPVASAQESFDISASGNGNSWGITTDGTHIWITDFVDAEVYKYRMDGTYLDSFDTASSGNQAPAGITQDGTYFWIVDTTDHEVYKYLMNGTYTGEHFDTNVSGNRQPRAITQDGTYFWITNAVYPCKVYKYSMDGTYQDSWGAVTLPAYPYNGSPWGITLAGTHIWIADPAAGSVFRYSKGGVFVDRFDISVGRKHGSRGITQDGTSFWVANTFDDVVYMSTITLAPEKPELVRPIENQPCFEWSTVEYTDNYRLLVDNNIDFSSPCENRILVENYYQIPAENALENSVYYWKVIAQNETGETASDVWSFIVGTPPTEDVTGPAIAAIICTVAITAIVVWKGKTGGGS